MCYLYTVVRIDWYKGTTYHLHWRIISWSVTRTCSEEMPKENELTLMVTFRLVNEAVLVMWQVHTLSLHNHSCCYTLLLLVTLICTIPAPSCSYYHNCCGISCLVHYVHVFHIPVWYVAAGFLSADPLGRFFFLKQTVALLLGFIWGAFSNTVPFM